MEKWQTDFVRHFASMQYAVHDNAVEKGWWENGERNKLELLCLLHSEISEACEAYRDNNPPARMKGFSSVEEELADVVIRIMDMAAAFGYDIAGAIVAKSEYNKTRPYRHGGKKA